MSEIVEFGKPVKFRIGGVEYDGAYGEGLLDAVRRYGYEVPSLCHHEAVASYGACRLCLVEVVDKRGRARITTSCNFPVQEGIDVRLDTPAVLKHRKIMFELLLAMVPNSPELKALAAEHGVEDTRLDKDENGKCILCGLCERVCTGIVEANAIGMTGRGNGKGMGTPYAEATDACIACGACVWVCPVNCIGLSEKDGNRTIERWQRTVPLAVCEKSGRKFTPRVLLDHFAKRLGGFDEKVFKKAPQYR
jgi:bidirectional [NiFe] hydrogenase diaphorase subunit